MQRFRLRNQRIGRTALLAAFAATATQSVALAHTGERAIVLLLPTGYYLVGGGFAVGATFLLLVFMPKGISDRLADWRSRLFSIRPPSAVPTSLIAFLALLFLLATGIWGERDPLKNPLPLSVWTVWWIGFTVATALLGNMWAYVNPWVGPYRVAMAAFGRTPAAPPLDLPERVGYWPAIALLLAFAWFEKISIAPTDPERLARAVAAYAVVTFAAMALFGEEAWLRRGEPFSVFFRFISQLSPFVWEPADGGKTCLKLALPGASLIGQPALPLSGTLFVLLTLTLESFDGISDTFWWLGLNGINPLEFPGRSAVVWINAYGLLMSWAILIGVYAGAVHLGWRLAGRTGSLSALLGTLVFSLMPIALAFHFAHYLTALLVDGQYAIAAATDPFGTGLDLFGIGEFHVTASFLNTYDGARTIWNTVTAAIVAGHVLGILLAHEIACRLIGDYRAAVLSQAPLALVMVAYTLFGLWLMSTPIAG